MSRMIEIDWHPDEATLRSFGFVALAGFGLLAAMAWFGLLIFGALPASVRIGVAAAFAGLGLLAAACSLFFPRANLPIYVGLTLVAYPIGFVLSHLVMGFLFFGMLTPLGLLFRVVGRDALHRDLDPEASTYWSDPRPRRGKESYFRQF